MFGMRAVLWLELVLGALSAAGTVIHKKPGESAILKCDIAATTSLEWHHGNLLIFSLNLRTGFLRKGTAAIMQRSKVKQERHLEILRVEKEDAGTFSCTGNGESKEYTLLVVSVSASPSAELQPGGSVTLRCEVEGLSSDSPVKWTRPDGRPHPGAGRVQLERVARSDAGTWVCSFGHGTETYSENLLVKIRETEAPTPSPTQSSKADRETPCPNCGALPPSAVDQLGWWLWVVVGVGALFALLLMLCVIVLCARVRRKKKKLQKMKSARQSLKPRKYCQCNCPAAAAKPQQGRRKGRPSAPPRKPLLME